jgi:hypothetical protein
MNSYLQDASGSLPGLVSSSGVYGHTVIDARAKRAGGELFGTPCTYRWEATTRCCPTNPHRGASLAAPTSKWHFPRRLDAGRRHVSGPPFRNQCRHLQGDERRAIDVGCGIPAFTAGITHSKPPSIQSVDHVVLPFQHSAGGQEHIRTLPGLLAPCLYPVPSPLHHASSRAGERQREVAVDEVGRVWWFRVRGWLHEALWR